MANLHPSLNRSDAMMGREKSGKFSCTLQSYRRLDNVGVIQCRRDILLQWEYEGSANTTTIELCFHWRGVQHIWWVEKKALCSCGAGLVPKAGSILPDINISIIHDITLLFHTYSRNYQTGSNSIVIITYQLLVGAIQILSGFLFLL